MNKKLIMAMMMGLTAAGMASAATNYVSTYYGSNILTNDMTWTSDDEWILDDLIYVGGNAVLTIEPGTVIRGVDDAYDGINNKAGTLIIARGSKLYVNGEEDNPVIMTDMYDDAVKGSTGTGEYADPTSQLTGQWGGLVVCGKTYIAYGTTTTNGPTFVENLIEGVAADGSNDNYIKYGGTDDDDDSGVIKYLSIRYGGTVLASSKEINGLSLYAVGRGTELHHVEVVNGLDDGYEWFGGTVNSKYLVAWNPGDDGFDSDEGFRGKNQFMLVLQGDCGGSIGSGKSDNGLEVDSGGSKDNAQPYALSQWYNLTLVGLNNTDPKNPVLEARDNGSPQIRNSVFMDFGSGVIYEDLSSGVDSVERYNTAWNSYPADNVGEHPASYYYQTQFDGNQSEIKDSVFYNINTADLTPATPATVTTYSDDGTKVEVDAQPDLLSGTGNVDSDVTLPILGAAQRDGTTGNITNINLLANMSYASMTASSPAPAGFYAPVTYKGAFGNYNWLAGWSLLETKGVVPTASNPSAPAAAIQLVGSAVSFQSVNGVNYSVESTTDLSNWDVEAVVEGDGSVMSVATIVGGLDNTKSYRVTLP